MPKKPAKKDNVTPKGEAKYCWLSKPSTKFKEEGEYSVKLLLSEDQLQPMIDKLSPLLDEAYNDAYNKANAKLKKEIQKHTPWSAEVDEDSGEETGMYEVSFKQSAAFKDKETGEVKPHKLRLFTKNGKPVPEDKPVYSGSVIQVAYSPSVNYVAAQKKVFLTLYISAVMVHEFGEGGGASGYGFDVDEDTKDDDEDQTSEATGGEEDDIPF